MSGLASGESRDSFGIGQLFVNGQYLDLLLDSREILLLLDSSDSFSHCFRNLQKISSLEREMSLNKLQVPLVHVTEKYSCSFHWFFLIIHVHWLCVELLININRHASKINYMLCLTNGCLINVSRHARKSTSYNG